MPEKKSAKLGVMRDAGRRIRKDVLLLIFICSAALSYGVGGEIAGNTKLPMQQPQTSAQSFKHPESEGMFFIDPQRSATIQHRYNESDVKSAVLAGLRWLGDHQFSDGVWDTRRYFLMCNGAICPGEGRSDYDMGVTALALNAFLSAAPHVRKRFGEERFDDIVRRGLEWIGRNQDADGCFATRREGKYIYGHAMATQAMARAFTVYGNLDYRYAAARGVDFLQMARNPRYTWRYDIRMESNDTSVTGWAAQALLESREAEIAVREAAFDGIRRWLDTVTDARYFDVSYSSKKMGQSFLLNRNDTYTANESLTAIGVYLRSMLGEPADSLPIRVGVGRIANDMPQWSGDKRSIDFYYWHYGTLAIKNCLERGNAFRNEWNDRVTTILLTHQKRRADGCVEGSWEAVDKWSCEGGRVYATAINILTLLNANF